MKEMPFRVKQADSPRVPIVRPAIIGPTTRERLNCMEFSAIAFVRSSRPTRSRKSDWCEGVVKALAIPLTTATAATSATETNPKPVAAASVKAQAICVACVTRRSLRRSSRSAATPASGASSSVGIEPANPTRPRSIAELERRRTSQPWATACIQVPTFERKSPVQ